MGCKKVAALTGAILWAVTLAFPAAALGQVPDEGGHAGSDVPAADMLAELGRLVLHARFEEALEAARGYLERSDLTPSQRLSGLELLAIAQIADRQETEARETLAQLYRRDPGYRLSDPEASPVVQAAFSEAREQRPPPIELTIEQDPVSSPVQGQEPVIHARVTSGADALVGVELRYRREGGEYLPVRSRTGPDGRVDVSIPIVFDGGAYAVEYYVTFHAPSGAALAHLGSPQEPLRLAAGASTALADTGETPAEGDSSSSILGEWWFWTAVGAGVLAAALTIGIAAGSSSSVEGSLGRGMLE